MLGHAKAPVTSIKKCLNQLSYLVLSEKNFHCKFPSSEKYSMHMIEDQQHVLELYLLQK